MCEKIREGNQMSLFPNDEDDVIEDSVVDDTIVKPSKRKRRSSSRKIKKVKFCKTCHQDIL